METIKDIKNFVFKNCLENQAFHVKSWVNTQLVNMAMILLFEKAITVLYNTLEGATPYYFFKC